MSVDPKCSKHKVYAHKCKFGVLLFIDATLTEEYKDHTSVP